MAEENLTSDSNEVISKPLVSSTDSQSANVFHEAAEMPVSGGSAEGENNSGSGGPTSDEIKGWNWGAFLLSWIWAIGNQTWIGLLALIPYVGFIMAIILGIKGNEWAWQNRKFESIEQFKAVQKAWTRVAVIIFIAIFVVSVFLAAALVMTKRGEVQNLRQQSGNEFFPRNYEPNLENSGINEL